MHFKVPVQSSTNHAKRECNKYNVIPFFALHRSIWLDSCCLINRKTTTHNET